VQPLKERKKQTSKILYPMKLTFKSKEKNKDFLREKFGEFVANITTFQEMLYKILRKAK
jgi:RNAse (barnase) inhibitor barstar